MKSQSDQNFPVVRELVHFDRRSGGRTERVLFNHRGWVVTFFVLMTLALAWQLPKLRMNASFESMIPVHHPYIANFLAHRDDLKGLGNRVTITVETKHATIFEPRYLEQLRQLNDEVLLMPGVDRAFMKSLWTPNTRWIAVTEDGLDGGPVMPDNYDGGADGVARVRANVERSGEIGQLVAANYRSSVLQVPLLETDPRTGGKLNYAELASRLEVLRAKYHSGDIDIHITGFAKLVGDLIDGARVVAGFFVLAILISSITVFWYTRCVRSTLLVVCCSLAAVVWQLGLLPLLGYALDPYSMLVPFLVFAIGMSHGAQKMNGIMQDIGRGTHRLVAARYTFRRLFLAGLTALACDAVGFAVLMTIQIKVIQDLAITAGLGVVVLVFTNLVLLPVLLSFSGVNQAAAARSLAAETRQSRIERLLVRFAGRRWATATVLLAGLLAVASFLVSRNLQVGDLDPGAPELRADSRYNRDNAFVAANYATSSDVLVVMIKTPENQCSRYEVLAPIDRLEAELQQLTGVESTMSLAKLSKRVIVGMNEGHFAWHELLPNQDMLNAVTTRAPRELLNQSCSLLPLFVFLKDHKADTLGAAVGTVERYAAANGRPELQFLLAAGNAGIEAATNVVVRKASRDMLFWVYGAVTLLCFVTFRSWRAVAVAILPLALTSMLCEALMVWMGIGVKVATLPVIALGVGIGVDYALYVLSLMLTQLRSGASLQKAYAEALRFTGKVVMLTGVTLGLAVVTWACSPIKFQADMGVLLAFMFIWNMLGALMLLPALAYFLLKPVAVLTVVAAPGNQVPQPPVVRDRHTVS
ncbi:efflux RND transporter permease subunit [Rugamonas apoptosis]|uniref:MMPL family transporter n=1 Tax=Rugamonas apoptosis TaxID=2758570 RepID=A0A7W2F6R7_9BURK|nr:MMPL family transporter [Rugamonas apoptosis]MBA5686157.1 MMPL family transporter [Rugamonas apoptosis]